MTTVPKDSLNAPLQPPNADKANPVTGKGQVNIGPPVIGNAPPGAYQAEPTTALGKGKRGAVQPTTKPFTSD